MPEHREPTCERSEVERLAIRSSGGASPEIAHLLSDMRMLIDTMEVAIDELADAVGYVSEYFQEKWGFPDTLAQLRATHAAFAAVFGPTPAR
jgi:HD-like signal output (HDOD) protein